MIAKRTTFQVGWHRIFAGLLLAGTALAAPAAASEATAQEGLAAEGLAAEGPLPVATAQATATDFEIPAQSLTDALVLFSRQSGVQVSAAASVTRDVLSSSVSGTMTAEAALRRLLAGSGISYRFIDDTSVALERSAAAGSESGPVRLDALVVEGQLLTRTLQDTQSSVVVITGEELERRGDVDLNEVVERTPGISRDQLGQSGNFVIRGIAQNGVGGGGNGQTITTNVDGVRISDATVSQTDFSTWDLEQIEILRGPQSTQSGRNALAGAVIVRSKDPTYDLEAKALGGLGNLGTREGAIALNAPVVEDKLAIRFALDHNRTDGSIDNPTLDLDDAASKERTTLRLSLRADPFDDFTSTLKLSRFESKSARGFIDRSRFPDERVIFSDVEDRNDTVIESINWRNVYQLNDYISLESSTTYFETDNESIVDRDLTATPGNFSTNDFETEAFDQELRMVYSGRRLNAVFGGFYADAKNTGRIETEFGAFTLTGKTVSEFENYAVFGEVEYDILPQLTIVAGGRYDWEKRQLEENFTNFSFAPTSKTFDVFLPKLGAVYRFTNDVSLGFTYQRGYRAGGLRSNTATGETFEFDPEFTDNYELAFRSQLYHGRVRLNANIFYTKWADQQLNVVNFPDITIENAGESRLFGGEVDIRLNPIPGLELFGALAYVDTEFTDFVNRGVDFSGNEFPLAADVTGAFGAEYFFENGFFIAGDASYTAAAFTEIANRDTLRSDNRFLVNTRAGYEAENWSAVLYATNLFDIDYVSDVINPNFAVPGEPLQFGIRVGVRF